MEDLKTIRNALLDKNNKIAIILGAGASKYSGVPLVREWVPYVFSINPNYGSEFFKSFLRQYSVNIMKEHYAASDLIIDVMLSIKKEIPDKKKVINQAIEIWKRYILPAKGDRLEIEDREPQKFKDINWVFGNAIALCYAKLGNTMNRKEKLTQQMQELLFLLFNIEDMVSAAEIAMAQLKIREEDNRHIPNIALSILFKDFSCWYRDRGTVSHIWNSVYIIMYDILLKTAGEPSEPYLSLAKFIKERNQITAITFNYDILLEEALYAEGIGCNYRVVMIEKSETHSIKLDKNGITVLKLHGSQWWWRKDRTQEIIYREDKSKELIKRKKEWGDAVIIGPSVIKHFEDINIIRLWAEAYEKLESADIVLIIGYSFPSVDEQSVNMIRKAVSNKRKKVIIVDTWPNRARLEEIIPSCEILQGSSENLIPQLVL